MTVLARQAPAVPSAVRLVRLVAIVLAGLLFTIGWTAGHLVQAAFWAATAVRLGYEDAHPSGGRQGPG